MRAFSNNRRKRLLGGWTIYLAVALAVSACNLTPGVPMPPPPRENFTIKEAHEDCRGIMVVEVIADPYTFEAGELVLITNTVTRVGIMAPVENDGSLNVEVPVANGEKIAIRRRTIEGNESMPIGCDIPAPSEACWEGL